VKSKNYLTNISELKKIVINFAMTFLQFGEGWGLGFNEENISIIEIII
jgi:hypothetical protein